jgi:8-oxo-dGTP pyrophosphatase MutT (NUDIX family)
MLFSGVVPYAFDETGTCYILVAREAYGAEKGLWSCFAGGMETKTSGTGRDGRAGQAGRLQRRDGDVGRSRDSDAHDAVETQLETACRECFEEAMGLLGTPETLRTMLQTAPAVVVDGGVHYLLHVQYNGFMPHAFAGVRAVYEATVRDAWQYSPYREKDAVHWLALTLPASPAIQFRRGFLRDLRSISSILQPEPDANPVAATMLHSDVRTETVATMEAGLEVEVGPGGVTLA